ncbi:hypothetical protein AtNW77_Chr5g0103171 [Arabidopsis thaliana]
MTFVSLRLRVVSLPLLVYGGGFSLSWCPNLAFPSVSCLLASAINSHLDCPISFQSFLLPLWCSLTMKTPQSSPSHPEACSSLFQFGWLAGL